MKIILVGCGQMAVEYNKVIKSMNLDLCVIGRGLKSAENFFKITSHKVDSLDLDSYLKNNNELANYAIISVGVESLASVCNKMINHGVKNILLEKPGAINLDELRKLNDSAVKSKSNIYIAYNRRFYHSVDLLKKQIEIDKGVKSCYFDFTEWSHQIEPLKIDNTVKNNWFMANSTHIVDLVFHIIGIPKMINSNTYGSLKWHNRSSIFTGNGLSVNNIPFAYHANWKGPGRWLIEFITNKHKLILCPIEKLKIVKIGSVKIEDVNETDDIDTQFKPGLFNQVSDFINNNKSKLCDINEQLANWEFYKQISNY
tara:strand:- start:528 stop:1466 length:939 start_codon:yes stop_codon:yes gene_type:complete